MASKSLLSVAYLAVLLNTVYGARQVVHRSLQQTQDAPQVPVGVLPPLPYATTALEPYIDNATTTIHHDKHFNTYVVNLRYLVGNYSQLANYSLAQLQRQVGSNIVNGTAATTLKNNGGGAWNHAFFFKELAPANSSVTNYNTSASDALKAAINTSYGNYTNFQTQFTAAATGVFGSGFAWLVATANNVTITTTPNQNNPLQTLIANTTSTTPGIPVLGIDVWEHAYYLLHNSDRASYISSFYKVINWVQISQNYQYAAAGAVPDTSVGPLLTSLTSS